MNARRKFQALDEPGRPASPLNRTSDRPNNAPLSAAPVHVNQAQSIEVIHDWERVSAIVIECHDIPDRCAMHITVTHAASAGSDVCFDSPCIDSSSLVRALTVEPSLATAGEGNMAVHP